YPALHSSSQPPHRARESPCSTVQKLHLLEKSCDANARTDNHSPGPNRSLVPTHSTFESRSLAPPMMLVSTVCHSTSLSEDRAVRNAQSLQYGLLNRKRLL